MKKINLALLTLVLLVPNIASAHTLTCDPGTYKYGDKFSCYANLPDLNNYDELSGIITTDPELKCTVADKDPNLTANPVQDPKTQFKLSGKPSNVRYLTMICEVIQKQNELKKTQVMIRDYKYHVYDSDIDAETAILRSGFIYLEKYVEQQVTEPVDTKPRDTTNNDSLLKGVYIEQIAEYFSNTFSKFETEYEISVDNSITKLDIQLLPENSKAITRIEGNLNLVEGENVIDIYVTNPEGTSTTCYTLYVKRLKEGEEPYLAKKDSSLKSLTVTGYAINFEKDTYDYTIEIDAETEKLEVNPIATNPNSIIDVKMPENLASGTEILITVTSEDKTTETRYHIWIAKEVKILTKELIIFIVGGVVGLAAIGGLIHSNNKAKKDPLLKLKNDKRKVKKGAAFDADGVPEAMVNNLQTNTVPEQSQTQAQNVITANSTLANIIQVAPTPVEDNRNKVTAVQSTLDLNVTAKAAPIAIPAEPQIIEQQINDISNSTLGPTVPTLNLTGTTNVQQTQMMQPHTVQPVQQVNAFDGSIQPQQVLDPYINNNQFIDQSIIASSGPIQTIQLMQNQATTEENKSLNENNQVTEQVVQTLDLNSVQVIPQQINDSNNLNNQ